MSVPLQLHGIVEGNTTRHNAAPPHRLLSLPGFDIIASDYALDPDTSNVPPDELAQAAMAHHHILLAYCADHALLPMRFGTLFSNVHAMRIAMEERAAVYVDALEVLAEHREYTIELLNGAPEHRFPSKAESGRGFLLRSKQLRDKRRSLVTDRQAFARDLALRVAALTDHPLHQGSAKPDKILDVSLLIPHQSVQGLRAIADRATAQAADLGLTLLVRGPWPAYHFDIAANTQEALCHDA